jgi:hypothetical protein
MADFTHSFQNFETSFSQITTPNDPVQLRLSKSAGGLGGVLGYFWVEMAKNYQKWAKKCPKWPFLAILGS